MRRPTGLLLAFLVALALVTHASGVSADGLSPEVVVGLKSVSDAVISPDGDYVAYVMRVPSGPDEAKGEDHYEIWVASTFRGEHRRFVYGLGDSRAPQWSPDGTHMAFLSDRPSPDREGDGDEDSERKNQVYVISMRGGEARQVTRSETAVKSFQWSPDGRLIAYVASDPKAEEEKEKEKRGEDWIVVDENLKPRRLWAVDVETGDAHRVTTTDISVWDFDWSPDGAHIAVSTTEQPRVDDSYMFKKLQIVPASGGEPARVCETWGKLGPPRWSPDGRHIAFRAAVSANDPYAGSVFVVSAPSGEAVNLTPDIEATVTSVDWMEEDELVFLSYEGTKTALNTIGADGEGLKRITKDGPVFYSFSFSEDGSVAAVIASTYKHPAELYLWKKGGIFSRGVGSVDRETFSNPVLNEIEFARQEVVRWSSVDGLEIEGLLMRPLDYVEGTRYPLVVQVHGGPEGVYLDGWNNNPYRWTQCLAARGYVVLMPNYRGSIGRGVAFSKGDHGDLGGAEFQDLLTGVDYLIELGLVDEGRVGMGGTSYGGYMSALAATAHTERFAATIDHAGISNWHSFTGTTDIPYEMCMVHWDFWVYDNPDIVWERSPIAHVNKADTPVLIVHGKADDRVDSGQAWELYTALKVKGVESELVLYPREGHGFRERAHRLDYMKRAIDWFDKHLME